MRKRRLLQIALVAAAVGAALYLGWSPMLSAIAAFLALNVAALLLFGALWWWTHDRRRRAVAAAVVAVLVAVVGSWGWLSQRREPALASEAELVGSYQLSRGGERLELSLRPDRTFTHTLLASSPSPVQTGRWRVRHDQRNTTSTVSFEEYTPGCVEPADRRDAARAAGQALCGGSYQVATVCRIRRRTMGLCFNAVDEYLRR